MPGKIPKVDRKYRRHTIDEKYLGIQEKRVDIPIVDNKDFRTDLIARIEAVTLKIIEQISAGQSPVISYSSGRNSAAAFDLHERNVYPGCSTYYRQDTASFGDSSIDSVETRRESQSTGETTVDFAMKRSRDKFVLMLTVMAEAHHLLLTNTTKTRRSLYYDLKNEMIGHLVPRQKYVDRALNDVANLLECAPWDLKLLATTKGLMAGNITLTLINNQVINCRRTPGGVLIPQIISNVTSVRAKARFVLVVEKDAVFQKLLEENCPRILNCVLVTGKGYPDVATRMLVKLLSEKLDLPVYIVVDADPFGVDIMTVYRFGSTALRRENKSLACPKALWLGIHPTELINLGAKTIPLTKADYAKLRSVEARTSTNKAVSKQLNVLREGKAEIEAVSSFSKNFLTATYLSYKIDGQDYI